VGPWKDDHLQSLETESQLKCSLMQNVDCMKGLAGGRDYGLVIVGAVFVPGRPGSFGQAGRIHLMLSLSQ
jgi:hypothetical protein